MSASAYSVSYDWRPNYVNASIGAQTWHSAVVGDPAVWYCDYWKPFYG